MGVQGVPKTPKGIAICGNSNFGGLGLLPSLEHGFKDQNFPKLGIFKLLEEYPFFGKLLPLTNTKQGSTIVQRFVLGKIL